MRAVCALEIPKYIEHDDRVYLQLALLCCRVIASLGIRDLRCLSGTIRKVDGEIETTSAQEKRTARVLCQSSGVAFAPSGRRACGRTT